MSKDLVAVEPTATVAEAATLMGGRHVGSALVIEDGRATGIFTERDVLRRVVGERKDPGKTRVAEVMTRELAVMKPGSTVEDAMTVISEKRIRHLPVVEDGRVVGVISQGDLNHWLIRNREVEVNQLVDYITGKYPA